jgi:hypothetical protein
MMPNARDAERQLLQQISRALWYDKSWDPMTRHRYNMPNVSYDIKRLGCTNTAAATALEQHQTGRQWSYRSTIAGV